MYLQKGWKWISENLYQNFGKKKNVCDRFGSFSQLTTPENTITYHNALCLSLTPKFCISIIFNFSWELAPRETENDAYAKFWGDKQRALWHVMVFSGVVNREHEQRRFWAAHVYRKGNFFILGQLFCLPLQVLIFAIFPAIRKNKFPQTFTPEYIFFNLNSLHKNTILRNRVCSITICLFHSKTKQYIMYTMKYWFYTHVGYVYRSIVWKYVFLLHVLNKNENIINGRSYARDVKVV